MKLILNWRTVVRQAWSVRLFALSILCQVLDVVLTTKGAFSDDPDARVVLQLVGVAFATAGVIARFIYQSKLHAGIQQTD